MILDPTREGIEVYYDNKITNIIGIPEICVDWVIRQTSDIEEYNSTKEIYDSKNVFNYRGEIYEQLVFPHLDLHGEGRVYADFFDKIGFKYDKVDVKRVDLRRSR